MCANFQLKWTTLTFLAQTCAKRKLGFEIQKSNVGIRISILEIPCVPIFRQNEHLWFFGPNLPKNGFWRRNFKNLSLDSESVSWRYYGHQFLDKTDNYEFLGPNLPKNGFWGRNFKNVSLDSESTPPIYHMCQFLVKMDSFWFFGLNLGKLSNYVQYFGLNIVEGVTENWVETEMSWLDVDGAGWRLKWAGWRWMELGGGGCTV